MVPGITQENPRNPREPTQSCLQHREALRETGQRVHPFCCRKPVPETLDSSGTPDPKATTNSHSPLFSFQTSAVTECSLQSSWLSSWWPDRLYRGDLALYLDFTGLMELCRMFGKSAPSSSPPASQIVPSSLVFRCLELSVTSPGWPRTHHVDQAGFKVVAILPALPTRSWDCRNSRLWLAPPSFNFYCMGGSYRGLTSAITSYFHHSFPVSFKLSQINH